MADTERTLAALATALADNTTHDITAQDIRDLLISVGNGKTEQNTSGWKDNVMPLSAAGVPLANAPTMTAFGVLGIREELAFAVNDYAFVSAIHINHDIKIGGAAYIHVHWSTDGADANPVKWQFDVMRALGHQQAAFSAPASITIQQNPQGVAWYHMIAEIDIADVLTLTEPDELLLITLKRITNGATENTDAVYGLTVDVHYESDRDSTLNKSPDFYV